MTPYNYLPVGQLLVPWPVGQLPWDYLFLFFLSTPENIQYDSPFAFASLILEPAVRSPPLPGSPTLPDCYMISWWAFSLEHFSPPNTSPSGCLSSDELGHCPLQMIRFSGLLCIATVQHSAQLCLTFIEQGILLLNLRQPRKGDR